MDEALGVNVFLHLILGLMMNGMEYKLLTKFSKMKPLKFQDIELEDAFEFTIDCYERLYKMGIVK